MLCFWCKGFAFKKRYDSESFVGGKKVLIISQREVYSCSPGEVTVWHVHMGFGGMVQLGRNKHFSATSKVYLTL